MADDYARLGPTHREQRRSRGQVWTPDWLAEPMVCYVMRPPDHAVYDPAVGEGAFFRAAKKMAAMTGAHAALAGSELHAETLQLAQQSGLGVGDLAHVRIADFALDPPGPLVAVVANPPFIRHHRVPPETKARLREYSTRLLGWPLDGRAGLHVYFLLRALDSLEQGGRLSFILPGDTFEGVFAPRLWRWICSRFRLEAVLTFSADATPFEGVDTNPVVVFIARKEPRATVSRALCRTHSATELTQWVCAGFPEQEGGAVEAHDCCLTTALRVGLTRPFGEGPLEGVCLGTYATVVRGIATGANAFFLFTRDRATRRSIPPRFLLPVVARTRDLPGDEVTRGMLDALDAQGRPTLLLSPDGRHLDEFPSSVRQYLESGEKARLPERPLIATRSPWYKMESRTPPPILFAYLGRRNCRFIRNRAGVVPLTGFLCVYPVFDAPAFADALWLALNDARTLRNLPYVGKTYGQGAVKVEPRALERLPLPSEAIADAKLDTFDVPMQSLLFAVREESPPYRGE